MQYQEYLQLVDQLLKSPNPAAPYDDADYFNYAKLNDSRMRRWSKTLTLDPALLETIQNIQTKQHWIIIVEPWCGDAAHVLPFLIKITEASELITYELQFRDQEPFLINDYLTNGGKAIPKLISRDEAGNDLFVWGPRPAGAQKVMQKVMDENGDLEQKTIALQNWYNADKGAEIMNELRPLLK